ncbi:hypothetical protein, partial [Streptomyces clavuligerus]
PLPLPLPRPAATDTDERLRMAAEDDGGGQTTTGPADPAGSTRDRHGTDAGHEGPGNPPGTRT